jgi:hypothetical protein
MLPACINIQSGHEKPKTENQTEKTENRIEETELIGFGSYFVPEIQKPK